MDELMRSLEGVKEITNEEVPKEVHGVLAAHIKTVELVGDEDSEANSSMLNLMQLHLQVQGQIKRIPVNSIIDQQASGICDQLKHFMIELLPSIDDQAKSHGLQANSRNLQQKSHALITLELVIATPLLPGSVSVLARATLLLHDIIHGSPLSGCCELKAVENGAQFATITADWVFCYGRLGFGESYQLKHASHKPGDYLHCSLFPRLTPSEQHADITGLMLNPQPTTHPVFIPFNEHAHLCVQDSPETVKESLPRSLMHHMTRLRSLQRDLKSKRDRRERLRFLEDIVYSGSASQHIQSVGVTARGAV